MSLLRSFPKLSFVLVLLSIVGIAVAQRSVGLLLVAGALAAISWYLTEGPRGRWLPRWVSNVLVVGVSLNVIVDVMQNPDDILGVLGRFILWLMIIKLYERRTSRDHGHLLGLSLLLMITGCLRTVDLFFGLILFAYALLGLYVLVLFQLHASHERSRQQRLASIPESYRLAPLVRPITGRQVSMHFRSLVVGVAIGGFVLGMLVFMLFPRGVGEGVVSGLTSPAQDRRPGYSDEVNLLTGGRITDSRRGVMSVRLLDGDGQPFVAGEPLLLRGAVLDRYEGRGRWRTSSSTERTLPSGPSEFAPVVEGLDWTEASEEETTEEFSTGDRVVTMEVEMLQNLDTLMALFPPVAVSMDTPQELLVDLGRLTIRQHAGGPRLHRYRVKAVPRPSDHLLERLNVGTPPRRIPPRLRNAEVHELARELLRSGGISDEPVGEPGSPERYEWNHVAAHQFMRYLHSSEFMYTTDLSGMVVPERGSRSDPISYFLLEYKRGHCEYFASALVSMCLHVGIQARLVTGFVAYEYDGANQRYNVVESNAHAWTEVRTGSHRWTTFDPTPPAVLRELHAGGTMTDRLRWFYDTFDGLWGRTVVEFDREQQTRMAESSANATFAQQLNSFVRSIRQWMDRVNQAFRLGPSGYIFVGVVAFAIVLAIVVLIKLMHRSWTIRSVLRLDRVGSRAATRMVRQLGFYVDMLDVLQRGGSRKPSWQPPLMFADALDAKDPAVAKIVQQLTDTFYAVRYGGHELSRQELAERKAKVRELASKLNVRAS